MAHASRTTTALGYKDITVGRYNADILPLIKEGDNLDPVDFQVRLIAALNGLTEKQVLDLPLAKYTDFAMAAKFLETPCDTSAVGRLADRYTLGDVTLIPCKDYEAMTAAQFIDFQQLSQDVEMNTVALLSVFLVPEGHKYNDGYDIRAVQGAIAAYLSVQDAFEILGFFFLNAAKLWRSSLDSSLKIVRRLKNKAKRKALTRKIRTALDLLTSGDG